jgi:hypothetical protein
MLCRSWIESVPLDGNVSSLYSGSLAHVISRLFGGYDYVIADDQEIIEVVVWGKRCKATAPVRKPVNATGPRAAAAPGRLRDVAVDTKTYSTCMALFL